MYNMSKAIGGYNCDAVAAVSDVTTASNVLLDLDGCLILTINWMRFDISKFFNSYNIRN